MLGKFKETINKGKQAASKAEKGISNLAGQVNENLVHFSDGGYYIEFGSDHSQQVKDMFYQYSYICKAYSKRFDLPLKTFSRSRG